MAKYARILSSSHSSYFSFLVAFAISLINGQCCSSFSLDGASSSSLIDLFFLVVAAQWIKDPWILSLHFWLPEIDVAPFSRCLAWKSFLLLTNHNTPKLTAFCFFNDRPQICVQDASALFCWCTQFKKRENKTTRVKKWKQSLFSSLNASKGAK